MLQQSATTSPTLEIFTKNANIGEATFVITVSSTLVEEPTWEDFSIVTINFSYTFVPLIKVVEIDGSPRFDPESTTATTL